jgi:hypothetical protein
MFASVRCYFVHMVPVVELARLVDQDFAARIGAQPGFVSYEFLDCGGGEAMTISVFREASQAEASRELARRWTEEALPGLQLTITEALHGEILVSRARHELLTPMHAGSEARYASARRYRLSRGDVGELMHAVDAGFADRVAQLDGFLAYCVLDCGDGELLSISLFRDQATAAASDELALRFVRDELGEFEIARSDMIGGGSVAVGRAIEQLLDPVHA